MVNRVSTQSHTNSMLSDNMRLQVKYADINNQISSGLKSETYKNIALDTQHLLALESTQKKLDAYNANANTSMADINIMFASLGQLSDLATSMLSSVTAALGGGQVPASVVASQADNALNESAGIMNLRMAGRYLFSGSDSDTVPVDLTDPAWTAQSAPSTANSSYYQGNTDVVSTQVSETMRVNYGVTADNPAVEKIFRAYNLLKNNPSSQADISEAFDLLQQGIDEVANVRGLLSAQANAVETQMDKNNQDKAYTLEVTSFIKETDMPTASVMLTEIQGQLESAYAASVRVLQLSLVNYL